MNRIVIILVSLCMVLFNSGCVEVTYSSSVSFSTFRKKENTRPRIVENYDYPILTSVKSTTQTDAKVIRLEKELDKKSEEIRRLRTEQSIKRIIGEKKYNKNRTNFAKFTNN